MNLIEHYIKEIRSVEDVTMEYEERTGTRAKEPLYKVDLTYNCYGSERRAIKHFQKSEWEDAKKKGYFMG